MNDLERKHNGDEEREYTFTRKVKYTVIDYIIKDRETKEWVEEMKVWNKIDSDHQPVEVTIRRREKRKEKQKGREKF